MKIRIEGDDGRNVTPKTPLPVDVTALLRLRVKALRDHLRHRPADEKFGEWKLADRMDVILAESPDPCRLRTRLEQLRDEARRYRVNKPDGGFFAWQLTEALGQGDE